VSEVASELSPEEQELLGELGRRLEGHLSILVARWERALDDLLPGREGTSQKGLRREALAAGEALLGSLARGRLAEGWQTGRAYGEAMALQGLTHPLLGEWLSALRQSLLTVLTQTYADDPRLDRAIVAFSKFFAPYMLSVTESFSARQQRLLLEQQEALRRAYEEAQRRVVELEVLNGIGRAISSTMEPDDLMELIYQQTGRLMETTNFYIALCDWGHGLLHFLLQFEEGQRQPNLELEISAGLTGHIARTGKPLLFPHGPDEFLEEQGIARVGRPSKSWLGVPMMAQERVVGVIAVQSYAQDGAYDEGHLRVLSTIASQAAVAVENARLYQEARRRAEEMEALYRIGATAASRFELEDILQSVYEQAGVVMDTSAFYVALYDRERDEIDFPLFYDRGARLAPLRVSRTAGGGLTGWVLGHGETVLIRDWEKEASEEMRRVVIAQGDPARSWLGVPMVVHGEVVGVIAAQSYQPGAFDERHQQMLEMIAHQAAAAIEHAHVDQEAQRRWREGDLLLEVNRILGATLDLQELLPAVLKVAIRAIAPAERGSVFLLDAGSGELVMRAQAGYSPEAADRVRLRAGEGFVAWVLQEKRGDCVADPRQDPRFQGAPADEEVCSLMAAPLLGRSGALGAIRLENCSQAGAFAGADLRLLTELAQQVSMAVENGIFFRKMQSVMRELEETTGAQAALLDLVRELSTPVVPLLEGVLVMPLVGTIDSQRGRQILERLLQVVIQQRAQIVLVDITGVPVVDTAVAHTLLEAVQAVRLLGGEVVLVGVTPEVAQTLVSLGVNLRGIVTRADLQGGLAYASKRVSRGRAGQATSPRVTPPQGPLMI